jgi:hypothetical protein
MWWMVPILAAAAVFGAVLATTPPGFQTVTDVLFGTPRGAVAEAAAYALGAASSLSLAVLLVTTALSLAVDTALRRLRSSLARQEG